MTTTNELNGLRREIEDHHRHTSIGLEVCRKNLTEAGISIKDHRLDHDHSYILGVLHGLQLAMNAIKLEIAKN